MVGLCSGCGKEEAESIEQSTESESVQIEEQVEASDKENNDIELDDNLEIDFTFDYSENIKTDVDYVVANSISLQEELDSHEGRSIKGEAFSMPELSEKYGLLVDNQGTGDVYSFLITRQGWEGDDEAIISVYRQGETEGTFTSNGSESWFSHQMREVKS